MILQRNSIKHFHIFSKFLRENLKNVIESSTFLEYPIYPNVKPILQKDSQTERPINILNSRFMKDVSTSNYRNIFQKLLFKYKCSFQKGHSLIITSLPITDKIFLWRLCLWSSTNWSLQRLRFFFSWIVNP